MSEIAKVRLERTDTSPHTAHQFDPGIGRAVHWPEALFNRPSIMACSLQLARKLLKAQPQNFRLAEGETMNESLKSLDDMTMKELKELAGSKGIEVPVITSKAKVRELIEASERGDST